MLRSTLLLLAFFGSTVALADESVRVCHGYGCLVQDEIHLTAGQLGEIRRLLAPAVAAADERKLLAEAIGRLYRWAGQQSPVRNDRAGNYADAGVPGRMDCIDHSTSTTRLLRLLVALGDLRWHRVLEPQPRYLLGLIASHWSAVIEETGGATVDGEAPRFAVDSWFVNNGEPAVILPLADWKKGAGPDV